MNESAYKATDRPLAGRYPDGGIVRARGSGDEMKKPVLIALAVVGVFAALAYARYGTVSPCGAVKQRIKAAMLEEFAESGSSASNMETAGAVIGLTLAGPMLDGFLDGMSPTQCVKALYRLETGDIQFDGDGSPREVAD